MYYQELIDHFVEMNKELFGERLTGIYLHGSMAMGCFNPDKSDIDMIVVINGSMTREQKVCWMNETVKLNAAGPEKGLEISVVEGKYCKPFVYPTPYEFHFSRDHLQLWSENPEGYIKRMQGRDPDLAAHFTIINRYGITLCGEEIPEVFGEVPKADYLDSIWGDVKNAETDITDNPMYSVLNLCRVLGFVKEDLCLSKATGGEWGLQHISEKHHALIQLALDCYRLKQIMQVDEAVLKQFAGDMIKEISQEIWNETKYY